MAVNRCSICVALARLAERNVPSVRAFCQGIISFRHRVDYFSLVLIEATHQSKFTALRPGV